MGISEKMLAVPLRWTSRHVTKGEVELLLVVGRLNFFNLLSGKGSFSSDK